MANVVKLVNGGAIQVRTGVIQGIGPVGPRGAVGPQGMQGEQGPQGETGPMGQILQVQGRTIVTVTNALAANTDTVIAFGGIDYDLNTNFFPSSSNIVLTDIGDYMLSVYLAFNDATAGSRSLWLQSATNGLIARQSSTSTAGAPWYMSLVYPWRCKAGNETINVLARSSAALNISAGAITVTRVGSGPKGDVGPVGPQGPVGAQGAKGDTGPQGAPGGAYTSYNQLVGH
jgi:hypothetical protein